MNKKFDIVILSYDQPDTMDGPRAWVEMLSKHLKSEGFAFSVIILRKENGIGELEKRLNSAGVICVSAEKGKNHLERTRWICEQINIFRPRVFIAQNIPEGLSACHVLSESLMERVMVIHSGDSHHERIADCYLGDPTAKAITRVVCVSESILEKEKKRLRGKGMTLDFCPCGAEVPAKRNTREGESLNMLYVGRMEIRAKRILDVVKAMAMACDQVPSMTGELAGNGSKEKEARELAQTLAGGGSLQFRGLLDKIALNKAFVDADICVLLSDYEGMPISLMEAMAHGAVPIITDIEGVSNTLVIDGQTGIIVNDRTDDFVMAIKSLVRNPGLKDKLSKNARALIEERYSMKVVASFWKGLASKSRHHGQLYFPSKLKLPSNIWKYPWGDISVTSKKNLLPSILMKSIWRLWISIPPGVRSTAKNYIRSLRLK